nr:putative disease resistance protein rga4 [Quercus suber]
MKRKVCFFFSFSNPIAFRIKMANKVKTIHESLKRINDEANGFGLIRAGSINGNPETIPNRETDSFLDHSEVVGRKDSVSEIVKLVTSTTGQQLSVIPIVGMAGLGKTTLAKLVYNHELVNMANKVKTIHESLKRINDEANGFGLIRAGSINGNPETIPNRETDSFLDHSEVVGRKDSVSEIVKLVTSTTGSSIIELSESIGRLIHLRFLHISCPKIKVLPKSIAKLYNLQTLNVRNCYRLSGLPKDLKNLVNLRCIVANANVDTLCSLKDIGQWKCLQRFRTFIVSQNADRRIEELGQLNQLRGQLTISNLENVRDKEEARRANLAEKAKIDMLGFYWSASAGRRRREVNYNNDEDVLEGLQPHQNLKSLQIGGFQGKKFPSWMLRSCDAKDALSLFDNLIEIILRGCRECEEAPTLGYLPCLKFLVIEGMDKVTCMGVKFYTMYSDDSYRNALFPALRKLKLKNMNRLVEWQDVMEVTAARVVFPCLEELTIKDCPQLMSAPCHFQSLNKLEIGGVCSTIFEKICSNLTTCTSLDISSVSELAFLPKQIICTSLRSLKIEKCGELSQIPEALHNLSSLDTLEVKGCPKLMSFPSIQATASLLRLLAISCGVEVLPTGLQFCTSLQDLSITDCPNLILIPDLPEFRSLTQLEISGCPNLVFIPDIGEVRSLTRVGIFKCQKLTRLPQWLWDCRLYSLSIGGFCEELDVFSILSSMTSIRASLRCLYLYGWTQLNSIPDEIQHFTAILKLSIREFDGMETLPEWLGNFSSLQWLELYRCKNLVYLPTKQAIQHLTQLIINDCPKLKERCAKGSGADWSKISDIPGICIDDEFINR